MVRCGVYLRQSDDPRDDELAVSRQWREIIDKICTPRGWDPIRYCDNDRTAVGKKRLLPDRDRMLADIESGQLQAMAVWDCDRLYREPRDLEDIIDLFEAYHVLLATVTGDIDLGTDNGRLFARVKGAFAKAETERRSARQKSKARQLADAGQRWGSRRAFGYDFDDRLIPEEAEPLAQLYHMILDGQRKLMPFVRLWNEQGIRTSLGNKWTSQVQLRSILLNPRNAGLRAYNGEIVGPAKWAKIVELDVWKAVYDILTDPARFTGASAGRVHLLVGIARCGLCAAGGVASTMQSTMAWSRGKRLAPTYRCRTCFGVNRSQHRADDLIAGLVIERLSRADVAELLIDRKRPDLDKLRREASAMREKLATLATEWADDLMTDEQLKVATVKAKARLRAAESAMEDAHNARLFKDLTGENADRFRELPLDHRRAIIDALMTVTFHKSERRGVFDPDSIEIEWKVA